MKLSRTEWNLGLSDILGYQFSRSSRDSVFISRISVSHPFAFCQFRKEMCVQ